MITDGKTVIFQRQSNGEEHAELMKMSIEGEQAETFYSNSETNPRQPRLSPDGRRIAFSEFDEDTFNKHLVIASISGDRFGKIENTIEFNLINLFTRSPDSKSLTISSSQAGVPNLLRLSLDGSSRQPITNFKSGKILNFAWSKDGTNLLIVRGITNNDLILIRDSALSLPK